jgi:hypothetical protein
MSWVIKDEYTTTRIVESENVLQLKQFIHENTLNCKVSVQHCDSYFWTSDNEKNTLKGPIELISNIIHGNLRPIADDKYVSIIIEFTMLDSDAEKIKTHKLSLTPNSIGKCYPTWSVNKVCKVVPYTCGVYKRERFDETFNALKMMKPNLTEKEFAYRRDNFVTYDERDKWDNDFVEYRLFEGYNGCLETFTDKHYIDTGKSRVCLSLLSIDVLNNIDYIKGILSAYKCM